MRSPQLSVGGKGASPSGTNTNGPHKYSDALNQMAGLNKRLDAAKDDILFESDISEFTMVILEEAAGVHHATGRQTSPRRSVKMSFENGFFLLRRDHKDFKLIHDFVFGNPEDGLPPSPHLGNRFWRVDERAQKLRNDVLKQSVEVLVSSNDKQLAQSIIEQLQVFVHDGVKPADVEVKPRETAAQKRAREQAEAEAEIAAAEAEKQKA